MEAVRLVVFDVGSVLVEAGRDWLDDIRAAGVAMTAARWAELEPRLGGLPRRGLGEIDNESYLPLFVEATGGAFTLEEARQITEGAMGPELPGIDAVFDALEEQGVATAALCNVNDVDWHRIFAGPQAASEYPTLARIGQRFGSHLLGVAKPDPRAYQAVEAGTGARGASILFFDDRPENIEAARALDWRAEHIDHTGDSAAQLLDHLRAHDVVRARVTERPARPAGS